MKLLTVDQVAALLGKSVRTAKRRPIPFSRDGRTRLYDQRDVDAYLARVKECPYSEGRAPRIITRRSSSEAVGLYEALAKRPGARPKPLTDA